MRTLYQLIGIITVLGFIGFACDSVTDSGLSEVEQSEIQSLEAGEGQWQGNKANSAKSLGKITFNTEVSSWDVGTGVDNGKFVTAEVQGVVLGFRATARKEGLLDVTGTNGNRVGVYEASTGFQDNIRARWNYEWHVDLSGAKANAKGKTLADYKLVLEQDYTEQELFGVLGNDPVLLPLDAEPPVGLGTCSNDTFDADFLCQQSWNPTFGNSDFDPEAEDTYNLRLVLTPETFNGPPLAVAIKVNVTD